MTTRPLALAALAVVAVILGSAWLLHRRETRFLVKNGGFEEPDLVGWTAGGDAHADSGAGVAHSGRTCVHLTGGDTLSQADLPVVNGRVYRVAAWVRGSGASSLALSLSGRHRRDADRLADWESVPAEWTELAAEFTGNHDGALTIEFTAGTHDGAPGDVYVDDVTLTEVALPAATQVEPGKGFDDEPSMARAADGTLLVAWASWRDGADTLQVARFAAKADGTFEMLGAWQERQERDLTAHRRSILTGQLRGEAVEYFIENDDGWHLRKSTYGSGHEGEPVPPSRGTRDEPLWMKPLVRNISACRVDDRWVRAWNDPSQDGFDVGTGSVERPPNHVVTHAPTIDRNPVLVAHGTDTWLLYENVETPGYRVSYETAHHVVVAKIDGDRLIAPKDYIATSPLWEHAESPAAAFDEKGRLWVAYRKPRPPTAGWDVYLTGWTGNAWVPPILVSARKGMNRRPGLVIDGNHAIVCYQADDLPEGWGDIGREKDAKSGVFLTSIELPDIPAAPQELEPLRENPAPWPAAEIRKRFGDDAPLRHETTVGGAPRTLLFGDLHSHSDTSVCERLQDGSADEVYEMQRDFLHLDFACITDHGEDFNPYLWNRQAKIARANDVPGKFTTFLGEEWTSSFEEYDAKHPYGFYGHRNVILADTHFPRWWNPRNRQTPAELRAELRAANANFVTIPHQLADTGNVPTDWSFADETGEPVAEIVQVRGSYEARDAPRVAKKTTPDGAYFLEDAWKAGVVCGVIASPDHGGGVGKACVWATENSREAILDALRARRCYGTTGARIALEVRVAGHFMGERTSEGGSGPVEIAVHATCPGDVAKVSISRGGEWFHAETPSTREFDVRFTDAAPPAGPKWYYVRIEQQDGELAWSSPVWLGASK